MLKIHVNIGQAYLEYIPEDFAENIEKSIGSINAALKIIGPREKSPVMWAKAHRNLAKAYSRRIHGDIVENYEIAELHLSKAAEVYTREYDPIQWAETKIDEGEILLDAPLRNKLVNLQRAISCFKDAENVLTSDIDPIRNAFILFNLGLAHWKLDLTDEDQKIAKQCFEGALKVFTREKLPEMWAASLVNLSSVIRALYTEKEEILESIENLNKAATVYTLEDYPYKWAIIQQSLGNNYYILSSLLPSDTQKFLSKALVVYQKAVPLLKDTSPKEWRGTLISVAKMNFNLGNFASALEYSLQVIEQLKEDLVSSISDTSQLYELSNIHEVFEIAAYCLGDTGNLKDSIRILNSGKARLLIDAIETINIDINKLSEQESNNLKMLLNRLNSLESMLKQPALESEERKSIALSTRITFAREQIDDYVQHLNGIHGDISHSRSTGDFPETIEEKSLYVFFDLTNQGSKIFLINREEAEINLGLINLPGIKANDFAPLIGRRGFIGSYSTYRESGKYSDFLAFQEKIDYVTGRLWEMGMEDIYKKAVENEVDKIVFIPQGVMQLLPLHAAWRRAGDDKRYLLDDFEVTYVPNLSIVESCLNRIENISLFKNEVFALINPTNDLPFARTEGDAIKKIFSKREGYKENSFIYECNGIQDIEKAKYMHFACHGFFNPLNSWQSGIVVGIDKVLTLSDISGLDLRGSRLITLSACETGIIDFQHAPNEFIGFPNGFLRTGALGVISTLWAVNDSSTSLLMKKFYENHIENKMAPSTALRRAQLWLRDLNRGKIEEAMRGGTQIGESEYTEYAERQKKIKGNLESYKPYSNPVFWAPFIYTGI